MAATKVFVLFGACFVALFAMESSAAPKPGPQMGPQLVVRSVMQATNFGPGRRSVRMMQGFELECMKRLKIEVPETFTKRIRPTPPATEEADGKEDAEASAAEATEGAANEITYDAVKKEAVDMLGDVVTPLEMQRQVVDGMLNGIGDVAKLMVDLSPEQTKELLTCIHTVSMQEPLQLEMKSIMMSKRLACELNATLKNEPAEKCNSEEAKP